MFCLFSFTEVKREEYTGADPGFQVRGGALKKIGANIFGYFVWKITILRQKINFFPILGCARAEYAPPPGSAPGIYGLPLVLRSDCLYRLHRGHDRMVVGFTIAYAIIVYYHH